MTTSGRPLRVGLVGANWAVQGHGATWRQLPGVEVVAICTSRQETADRAAQANGIARAYGDYRDMMRDPDIDLVSMALKPAPRYPIAVAALEAGKHVYQAVPYAVTVAQAEHMRDLQQARGLVGTVDSQTQWMPAFRCMADMIADGFLGDFYHARADVHLPLIADGPYRYPLPGWLTGSTADGPSDASRLWLGEAESGAGAWRNFGAHTLIDLARLFGPIEEAIGDVGIRLAEWSLPNGTTFRPTAEDIGTALVRFRDGGTAAVSTSWCTPDAAGFRLEAWGSRGRLEMRSVFPLGDVAATLYAGDARPRDYDTLTGELVRIPDRYFEVPELGLGRDAADFFLPFRLMFLDILRAVRTGGDAAPSFVEASAAQRGVEAVLRSMATRGWVRLAEVG